MLPHSLLSTKLSALEINFAIGIAGFILSMICRKSIATLFERDAVRLMAKSWIVITACGMAFALVL